MASVSGSLRTRIKCTPFGEPSKNAGGFPFHFTGQRYEAMLGLYHYKARHYRWMRGYWEVLVDLFTSTEGESDLVLFVRVYEDGPTYRFEVQSVHVP